MSEGIERLARAARAIVEAHDAEYHTELEEGCAVTRAVLTALRDECGRNEGMIEAGVSVLMDYGAAASVQDISKAMIDHLLAPETLT